MRCQPVRFVEDPGDGRGEVVGHEPRTAGRPRPSEESEDQVRREGSAGASTIVESLVLAGDYDARVTLRGRLRVACKAGALTKLS
jgi:hypothetical protein